MKSAKYSPSQKDFSDAEHHMSLLKSLLFPKPSSHFRLYVHIVPLNPMNPKFLC